MGEIKTEKSQTMTYPTVEVQWGVVEEGAPGTVKRRILTTKDSTRGSCIKQGIFV